MIMKKSRGKREEKIDSVTFDEMSIIKLHATNHRKGMFGHANKSQFSMCLCEPECVCDIVTERDTFFRLVFASASASPSCHTHTHTHTHTHHTHHTHTRTHTHTHTHTPHTLSFDLYILA